MKIKFQRWANGILKRKKHLSKIVMINEEKEIILQPAKDNAESLRIVGKKML